MPARNKFLDKKINKLLQMYGKENYTKFELAIYFNVHEDTIEKRLKEYGISNRIDLPKNVIVKMYLEEGYTQLEIAKHFDVSKDIIIDRLKKWCVSKIKKTDLLKEKIIEMYKEENYTQEEIAKHLNLGKMTVYRKLKEWNIRSLNSRKSKTKKISKDVLYSLYWNEEKSMRQIAEIFKCCHSAISRRMKEYNIQERTPSEVRSGRITTEETKKRLSESFFDGTRKVPINNSRGCGTYYNTPNQGRKWMRSDWERKADDYLTKCCTNWYYEYRWLKLSKNIHYLPDFYLPEEDKYIEVKGWKTERTMRKYELAKEKYNIELWDHDKLTELNIL